MSELLNHKCSPNLVDAVEYVEMRSKETRTYFMRTGLVICECIINFYVGLLNGLLIL